MDAAIAWITENQVLIGVIWGAVVALLEVAKRVIPGTKDDTAIVAFVAGVNKVATLGATTLLPNQDGKLKK